MLDVFFFTSAEGKSPVEKFINEQNPPARRKIYRTIDLLKSFGLQLPGKHLKRMSGTESLWELRIKASGKNYRIFFSRIGNRIVLLLHAIAKKEQKTPKQDIKTAQERLKQYEVSLRMEGK